MIKYIVIDDKKGRTNYLKKELKEKEQMVFLFPRNQNYTISDTSYAVKDLIHLKDILDNEIKDTAYSGISIIYDVELEYPDISTEFNYTDFFNLLAEIFLKKNIYFVNSSTIYAKGRFDKILREKYSLEKEEINKKSDQINDFETREDVIQLMEKVRKYFNTKPDFKFINWYEFAKTFSSPDFPNRGPGHVLSQYRKGDPEINNFIKTLCDLLYVNEEKFYEFFPIERLYSNNNTFNNRLTNAIKYAYDRDYCLEIYGVLFSIISYLNKVISLDAKNTKAKELKSKVLQEINKIFTGEKDTTYSFSFQFKDLRMLKRVTVIFNSLLNDLIYHEGKEFSLKDVTIDFNESINRDEEVRRPDVSIILDFDLKSNRFDFFEKLEEIYSLTGRFILRLSIEERRNGEGTRSDKLHDGHTTTRNLISFCILNNTLRENGQEFVSYRFLKNGMLRLILKGYDSTTILI